MKKTEFRIRAAVLLGLISISVLSGCATDQKPPADTLTKKEFRVLYPRQYLDSLDPSEQRDVEDRVREEQWRREGKR